MSLIKDNHVYSYSQLSSFSECPYEFYLTKIEKIDQVSNGFAEQGTLIHDLIDKWAKGMIAASDLPYEYERRYPDEVVTSFPKILPKGYANKAFEQGLNYFKTFDEFAGFEIIGTETKFRTDISGRPFVGIVDMVMKDEMSGELIVLDHKSKSLTEFKKHEDDMYRQQLLYAKYIYEEYGVYPDLMAFNLFKEGGLKQFRKFTIEDYNNAIDWATKCIEGIEQADIFDMMECKKQPPKNAPDFYCTNICAARKECTNGSKTYKSKKG